MYLFVMCLLMCLLVICSLRFGWLKKGGLKSRLKGLAVCLALMIACNQHTVASIRVYEFDSPQQEAQYQGLIAEFRCPTCQNQNLAGSDAPIAQDLKQKTYEMVKDGRSDGEIRQFMLERYGDFISYKPPVRPSTWILWFFPPVLLVLVLVFWVWRSRQHKTKTAPTAQIALSDDENAQLNALLATHAKISQTPTNNQALTNNQAPTHSREKTP